MAPRPPPRPLTRLRPSIFTPPVHAVCSRRRLSHARTARAAAARRTPHAARRARCAAPVRRPWSRRLLPPASRQLQQRLQRPFRPPPPACCRDRRVSGSLVSCCLCLHLVLLFRLAVGVIEPLPPRGRAGRRALAAHRPRRAAGRTRSARAPRVPPIWRRPAPSGAAAMSAFETCSRPKTKGSRRRARTSLGQCSV